MGQSNSTDEKQSSGGAVYSTNPRDANVNGTVRTGHGVGGARPTAKEALHLYINVYEPPNATQMPGFGIYHSGAEINDVEYSYAGGAGVFTQRPRTSEDPTQWKYKESIDLGPIHKSQAECYAALEDLKKKFPGTGYNIMANNCNHFVEAVCKTMNKTFPSWINRAANVGKHFHDGGGAQGMGPGGAAAGGATATAAAPPAKSVFESGKGYRLADGKEVDEKTKAKNDKKAAGKATTTSSSGARKNPWADASFVAAKTGATTTTTK